MTYIVLIPCRDDRESYAPGDIVTDADFPPEVIQNWLEIEPPVLALAFDIDDLAADEEE